MELRTKFNNLIWTRDLELNKVAPNVGLLKKIQGPNNQKPSSEGLEKKIFGQKPFQI